MRRLHRNVHNRPMHDVIVVGLGAMGSAAAQHLAERGQRVLALEQFAPNHTLGSSHGASRMIRQSYWEHPDYVPLLLRAYELWERLEHDTGADLLHLTGGLVVGSRSGELVGRSLRSAQAHALPHEVLEAAELRRRFPQISVYDDTYALFEARAGYLRAEQCLSAQLSRAAALGAELHFYEPVVLWRSLPDGSVEVTTPLATYQAQGLVLTAGPWASALLRDAGLLPLTVTRQVLFWFQPSTEADLFAETRCPVYIFEPTPGSPADSPVLYGFPETAEKRGSVKVALHGSHDVCTPNSVDRVVHPAEVDRMRDRLRTTLPALADGRFVNATTCLYTMTPDEHFLIDTLPSQPNVVFAAGFSGHGFKFANLVGEILADLATTGRTSPPIELFRCARFASPRQAGTPGG